MIDIEMARTLSVVMELAEGKHLTIDKYQIGMGTDMSIGVIMTEENGEQHIGGLSTMDLSQLNSLLNKHNIGHVIPDL